MNFYIEYVRQDSVLSFVAIVLLCIALLYSFNIFRQSPIVSFLVTGVLVGPYGLNLLPQGLATNEHLGELAIAFLMFLIGITLDPSVISRKDRRRVILGLLQIVISSILLSFFFLSYGFIYIDSLRLGLICSMSSTAVVLKVIEERKDNFSPYAINATTILIIQDFFAVLLMAIMALPSNLSDIHKIEDALISVAKIITFIPTLYIIAHYLLPRIIRKINKNKQPELFMLALLIVVLGASVLGHYLCDSSSMGAFVAGFALAGSSMAFQIRADIDPFKQVFLSIFFLTIGASFNIFIFQTHWLLIVEFLFFVLLLKIIGSMIALWLSKQEIIKSFRTAMAISQVGEFSLLLAVVAQRTGWLNEEFMQVVFALVIISMGLTPFLINIAHAPMIQKILGHFGHPPVPVHPSEGARTQAIVIGYGIAGKECINVLKQAHIDFSIIDQNALTVEALRAQNIKAIFGNASRDEILEAAGIQEAQWLIIAVPSSVDRLTITCEARLLNPKIHIIVRSHFVQEKPFLQEVGADHIISEEEAVSDLLSHILKSQLETHPS